MNRSCTTLISWEHGTGYRSFLALFYFALRRHLHSEYNLFNVGKTPIGVRFNPVDYPYRTADGEYNDPFNGGAGSEGTFFGRNVLPVDQKHKLRT